jgi:hypothetical protein
MQSNAMLRRRQFSRMHEDQPNGRFDMFLLSTGAIDECTVIVMVVEIGHR